MTEVGNKDPAIKLFGRTISLPDHSESLDSGSDKMENLEAEENRTENSLTLDEVASIENCNGEQTQSCMKQPCNSQAPIKPKVQQEESDGGDESKLMRRPDKIIPCPRCNSSYTKFCYFNNYNVNQPRHFCKSCQRYWTAGGTVRNVPVGAGRLRNKNLASDYRQVLVTSDLGNTMVTEGAKSANRLQSCEESSSSCTDPNEMVLKFGPDSPHFDSSAPNLPSNNRCNRCSELDLCNTSGSSPHSFYHYVVPTQDTPPVTNANGQFPLGVSRFVTPNITYQIVPVAYMNCVPVWVAGSGNISLAVTHRSIYPSFLTGSRFKALGKHSRDENVAHEGRTQETVSAPKTLRIQQLDEA